MPLMQACESWNQKTFQTSNIKPEQQKKIETLSNEDFCNRYQKVIVEKGDGEIKASVGVKKRLLANELIYKCDCEGSIQPICTTDKR